MKNSGKVLSALVSVEFLLYTICLCAPQWLVMPGVMYEGLFAICNSFKGLSSCTALPAWIGCIFCLSSFESCQTHSEMLSSGGNSSSFGSYSLAWMFLAGSCTLSLATLFALRAALIRRKRAIAALLLNIISVAFCVSALIAFMVSIEEHFPDMLKFLGWAFYTCCATLLYASLVSVALGLLEGSSSVGPVNPHNCQGLPVISP